MFSSRLFSRIINNSIKCTSIARSFCQAAKPKPPPVQTQIVEASKRNIDQSPFKIRFLLDMIRGMWVPDALAQLKFSPKKSARFIAQIIKRAIVVSNMKYNTIPEDLIVHEIFVTKGMSKKHMTIMAKGRVGIGYQRWAHVVVKIKKIDFDNRIETAKTLNQKQQWAKKKEYAEKMRTSRPTYLASTIKETTEAE